MTRISISHEYGLSSRCVVRSSKVIAGTRLEPLVDATVVIEGNRIAWVGSAADGPDADVVLEGVTLLPGLVDTHVHLWSDCGPQLDRGHKGDVELTLRVMSNLERFLRAGVTTVRDLGTPGVLAATTRDSIECGELLGPRLVVANRVITTTGGHGYQMGIECDDDQSLRRAVRQLVKDGSDWIKVMASGGFVHFRRSEGAAPFFPLFNLVEMQTIVDEAHRYGLRVAAHCQNRESIENAFLAGVDTIEHCTFAAQPHAVLDERLVSSIASRGTPVVPTVNNYWLSVGVPWAPCEIALGNLRRLYELGVRLVAGTDMGIPTTEPDLYWEGLRVFAEIGMGWREIMAAATVEAASAIGLEAVTGAIEVGLSADLVGLEGDPTADVTAYEHPVFVMSRGEIVSVGSLIAMPAS